MVKTILSTVSVATLIAFSGCSAITDNPVANAVKGATNSVVNGVKNIGGAASDTAKSASGAALSTGGKVVDGAKGVATGKTSLKDMAKDKAVEAADSKTDGKASKVLDAVK